MGLDKSHESDESPSLKRWLIPAHHGALSSVLIRLWSESSAQARPCVTTGSGSGRAKLWRLLTGHFAHLSWIAPAYSTALGLAAGLVPRRPDIPQFASTWLLICRVCSLACTDRARVLVSCSPELYWYVGMSGMLHGLLMAASVARWRDARPMDTETVSVSRAAGRSKNRLGTSGLARSLGPQPPRAGQSLWTRILYGAVGGAYWRRYC